MTISTQTFNKLLAIIFPVILFIAESSAGAQVRSNLEIFDDELSKELERVLFKPDLRRDIQFIFLVNSESNSTDETRFLNSLIKKTAERNKIWASLSTGNINSNDSVYNTVYIQIVKLQTKYPGFAQNRFLGTKLVRRNLISLIGVAVKGINYNYALRDTLRVNYIDNVELDEVENLQSEDYKFTQAEHPKVSLYEEIVFPVSVIVVSVAAAILFFAIRSK